MRSTVRLISSCVRSISCSISAGLRVSCLAIGCSSIGKIACCRGGRPFHRPNRALWFQVGGSHLLAGASIKVSGDNKSYDRHDQRRQTEIIDGIAQEEGRRHQQYAETRSEEHTLNSSH